MLNKKVENLAFAVSEVAKERREMLLLLKEMKEEKRQEKNMRVVSQVILSGKLVPPQKKGENLEKISQGIISEIANLTLDLFQFKTCRRTGKNGKDIMVDFLQTKTVEKLTSPSLLEIKKQKV